jgi:hypothetical protein
VKCKALNIPHLKPRLTFPRGLRIEGGVLHYSGPVDLPSAQKKYHKITSMYDRGMKMFSKRLSSWGDGDDQKFTVRMMRQDGEEPEYGKYYSTSS